VWLCVWVFVAYAVLSVVLYCDVLLRVYVFGIRCVVLLLTVSVWVLEVHLFCMCVMISGFCFVWLM